MADPISNRHDLAALLASAGPRLHALLTRLTLRTDLAEELMQDLFIKLANSSGFHQADDPVAYAFRAAIHLAMDVRRRQRRRPMAAFPSDLPAPSLLPIDDIVRTEQAQLLISALETLTPLTREAAVLHYIQQYSYEETARIMGKSAAQARALCQDALRQLRVRFRVPAGGVA